MWSSAGVSRGAEHHGAATGRGSGDDWRLPAGGLGFAIAPPPAPADSHAAAVPSSANAHARATGHASATAPGVPRIGSASAHNVTHHPAVSTATLTGFHRPPGLASPSGGVSAPAAVAVATSTAVRPAHNNGGWSQGASHSAGQPTHAAPTSTAPLSYVSHTRGYTAGGVGLWPRARPASSHVASSGYAYGGGGAGHGRSSHNGGDQHTFGFPQPALTAQSQAASAPSFGAVGMGMGMGTWAPRSQPPRQHQPSPGSASGPGHALQQHGYQQHGFQHSYQQHSYQQHSYQQRSYQQHGYPQQPTHPSAGAYQQQHQQQHGGAWAGVLRPDAAASGAAHATGAAAASHDTTAGHGWPSQTAAHHVPTSAPVSHALAAPQVPGVPTATGPAPPPLEPGAHHLRAPQRAGPGTATTAGLDTSPSPASVHAQDDTAPARASPADGPSQPLAPAPDTRSSRPAGRVGGPRARASSRGSSGERDRGGAKRGRQRHGSTGRAGASGGGGSASRKRVKTKLCHAWMASGGVSCPRGARCDYAHGKAELRAAAPPRNRRWRTKLCSNWLSEGSCPHRSQCAFAHGTAELQEPAERSHKHKLRLCRNWLSSWGLFCPMAHTCSFAHGVHELREWAAPPNHRYKSKLCNNWVTSQGRFCPRGAQCHFAHGDHELRPEGSEPPAVNPAAAVDPADMKGDGVGAATQARLVAAGRAAVTVARGTSMPGTELDDDTLLSLEAVTRANDAIFEAAAAAGILPSAKPDMSVPVDPALFHTGGGLGPKPFVQSGRGGVVVVPAGAGGQTQDHRGKPPAAAGKYAYFTSPAFTEVTAAMQRSQVAGIKAMALRARSRGKTARRGR